MKQPELIPFGMGIDKHARLFKYGDTILRAIHPNFTEYYNNILSKKIIYNLIADNILIPTEISSLKIDGYDLVLKHPILPIVSYPFEWTPSMFKDAALNILKLNVALAKHGLCTQDAHPWNVLFDGPYPKFVDFTSIIDLPSYGVSHVINQFNEYCTNPLLLMAKGYHKIFRSLTHEIFCYPDANLLRELYGPQIATYKLGQIILDRARRYAKHIYKSENLSGFFSEINRLNSLINRIERIDVRPMASEWSNYYSGENELPIYDGSKERLNSIRTATPKHAIVDYLLENIRPNTVLDIGCNRGLYSQMAASRGAKVIGIDMDEQALDQMYYDSKNINSYVIPLYINAVAPEEAIGFKEIPFASVTERLKSDCVLCFALVHHLVFKVFQMDFMHISKLLDSYSNRYLIVEFIPKEDKYVSEWYTLEYSWYNVENFKSSLSQHFHKIEHYESFPAPRVILFCEK
jgi:2-polyprenyl-3-methyl-5-hydroxy-6-metoxy-1,4-benzoquinol methylase